MSETSGEDGPRRRVTYQDVKASFNDQIRNLLIVRLIGRPIANRLTPFFYNAGWSANQMTSLRLAIAVAAVLGLASGTTLGAVGAAIGFYLCFIGDCLDGNLARLADSASYWGKFYDGLADRFYYLVSPFACGIGLWAFGGDALALIVGAATSIAFLYSELIRSRLAHFRLWMRDQTGAEMTAGALSSRLESWAGRLLVNGTFIAPLALFLPEGLTLYLWALVIVEGVPALVWSIALLDQAYRGLMVPRKSMHAAGVDPASARMD